MICIKPGTIVRDVGAGYPPAVAHIAIVHASMTGGSAQLAAAAAAGVRSVAGATLSDRAADEADPETIAAADGVIFAFPENLAAIAGTMKAFIDRAYYPLLGRIEGRPYGLIVCAGSDGDNAVRQFERIATGWRLRPVAPPLVILTHAQTPEAILAPKTIGKPDLARARELGQALAEGLAMGIF